MDSRLPLFGNQSSQLAVEVFASCRNLVDADHVVVALSSTSVDTCEDMDVTEDMEDIVLMADKSHSYMSPEMARWADVKYGNNKGALVEYKVGTSMTLPATWAEKGKAIYRCRGSV